MINPFPEEWELIALFEAEPFLTDHDIPWCYNQLTFKSLRGLDRIECEIEPGFEALRFRWFRDGLKHVDLDLNWLAGLQVKMEEGKEVLHAFFREKSDMKYLAIQLKPHLSISFATKVEIQPFSV